MNLQDRLQQYNITPSKRFGQNFLVNAGAIQKIITALDSQQCDHILEIGPGPGTMTEHLITQCRSLTAVDLDHNMITLLRGEYDHHKHVAIIHDDILKLALPTLPDGAQYKVLGNIPYNISSPIIFWLIEHRTHFSHAIITMQKEVAQRLVAQPGGKDYGALSVGAQAHAHITKLFDIQPGSFWPAPKVTSSTVRLDFTHAPFPELNSTKLREVTRRAFAQRRKMLRSTIPTEWLETAGIDGQRRPETLSVEEFIGLSKCVN